MNRIAIVFEDSIFDRKGSFRAKLERARNLVTLSGFWVDVWCVQTRYTWIERLLLGKRFFDGVSERQLGWPAEVNVDGIPVKMIWMNYTILDHFLFYKLKRRPLVYPRFLKRMASKFASYDIISAHSFEGGFLAVEASKLYGVPFCVTWHGSDIHTKPFRYPCIRPLTSDIMSMAKMNFFVSRALLETSEMIGSGSKQVLYNGCSKAFCIYDDAVRIALKYKYQLDSAPVVGFVGSLERVKNVSLLPSLFTCIQRNFGSLVSFWIIGDGRERNMIQSEMRVSCRFFGNLNPEALPDLYNCMDLLVLPSQNEGLPLVLLEAINCGCRAVGSRVGGIPEVLDEEHCVPLGDDFVNRFAKVAAEVLSKPFCQNVPAEMSWEETARKEAEVYENLLS